MPGLSIRNISPEVLVALRHRAARHHRSLHGELHAILEETAAMEPRDDEPRLEIVLARHSRGDEADWSRQAIYDEHHR